MRSSFWWLPVPYKKPEKDIEEILYILFMEQVKEETKKMDSNEYSVHTLISIRDTIESMNKLNQTQVLSLLSQDIPPNMINDNKNGIFINLTDLKDDIILKLINYIQFVNNQDNFLKDSEQQKAEYFHQFYGNAEKIET